MSRTQTQRMVMAGLVVPLLVYPCLTGLLWLLDAAVGDQSVWYYFLYESRRNLFFQVLWDWGHALPWLYGIVILVWLPAFYGLGRLGLRRTWLMTLVGAMTGACLAWYLAGTAGSSAVAALAITGALAGWLLNITTSDDSVREVS